MRESTELPTVLTGVGLSGPSEGVASPPPPVGGTCPWRLFTTGPIPGQNTKKAEAQVGDS